MIRTRDSRGSASLELAILAPGLLLFIAVIVFAGRVSIAGQSVQQAADEAAREASIARTQAQANNRARSAAETTLGQQGLECTSLTVDVDTTGFNRPVGQAASITTRVRCPVRLGDLAIPGLPGTRVVIGEATSPIDTYRTR